LRKKTLLQRSIKICEDLLPERRFYDEGGVDSTMTDPRKKRKKTLLQRSMSTFGSKYCEPTSSSERGYTNEDNNTSSAQNHCKMRRKTLRKRSLSGKKCIDLLFPKRWFSDVDGDDSNMTEPGRICPKRKIREVYCGTISNIYIRKKKKLQVLQPVLQSCHRIRHHCLRRIRKNTATCTAAWSDNIS
jgi:hypothetical protein